MLVQVTIDSLIGNSAMEYCKCIGFKLTGAPCTRANALKDVVKASKYTKAASLLHCSTSEGRADLEWLAALLLCNRDHQKHSYEVMEIWHSQARQRLAVDEDTTASTRNGEEKQDPPSKNMSSQERNDSDPKAGDISVSGEGVRKVKTNVQTRSMTARAARKGSEDVELEIKSRDAPEFREHAEKVKTNVQTRSMTAQAARKRLENIELEIKSREDSERKEQADKVKSNVKTRSMTSRTAQTRPERLESPPEFIEHPKSKRHLSAVNAEVMKHILNESPYKPNRRLTEKDLKAGYIYAFTRPSSPGYVKIGLTTKTVIIRLKRWSYQCKYVPHQETPKSARKIPYVAQIERLILAELSLHRRKESVCNGGAGCRTIHHEWLEVELDLALEVIDRWCSWAEKRPYDENGVLRDEWEAHTKVPVRPASRNEREQGNRWQEWIDSFPTTSPPNSANDPPSTSAKSEEQLIAPHKQKAEQGSKLMKLRRSPSESQTIVQSLASKPGMVQIRASARPSRLT